MIEVLDSLLGAGGGAFTLAVLIGLAFGAVGEQSGFCLRAAVEEWFSPAKPTELFREGSRTAQYLTAIMTAVALTYLAVLAGVIDLSSSLHRTASFTYVGTVVGGLTFGVGMVLAGGCISRLTILAARGNLRSWWAILVLSIAAWATLGGILSPLRLFFEGLGSAPAIPHFFTPIGVIGTLLVLALLVWLSTQRKPAYKKDFAFGAAVGVLVTVGWFVTSQLAADPFTDIAVSSLSFTRPTVDTLQAVTIWTGVDLTFGFGLILGCLLGAFLSAAIGGRLFIDGFRNEPDPLRYGLGGVLMGFGGILGLGCSLGQGLSGFSTLAVSSVLVFISIIVGASITMVLRKPSR